MKKYNKFNKKFNENDDFNIILRLDNNYIGERMKNKILTLKGALINSYIYYPYYHKKIDEKLVYVESKDGNDLAGNILSIVQELSTGKYGDLKICIYAKKNIRPKIKKLEKNYSLKIHRVISKEGIATKVLEEAKYIITDSGMRPKYVKRPGQVFLNTWHGTPLKVMGKYNESEEHRVGNIQEVFFACDYLLYPNEYMKDTMLDSYMIKNLYPGKILLEGYPRNSIFFEEEKGKELKKKLGYGQKQLFAYMPTYKGILTNRKDQKQTEEMIEYLKQIDEKLKDNQVLLVKLHVFNREKLDFKEFKHVKPFPIDNETYEVLNMCDCLITDYSSVMFDYANTKRKIILFNYDEEEYKKDRGFYFPLSDLPFPKVQNTNDLINELNTPKNYEDKEFLKKFCTYDRPNAVEYICKHVFNGEKVCKEETIKKEDKQNILIFGGSLKANGITSSLINILSHIDKEKYNFYLSFRTTDKYIEMNHAKVLKMFPEGVKFCPLRTTKFPTIKEKIKYKKFLKKKVKNIETNEKDIECPKEVHELFKRELKKHYNTLPFDKVINYDGYGRDHTFLFSESKKPSSIWVHSDMINEIKTKGNETYQVLREAYNHYDNVVVVSDDIKVPTSQISGRSDNIKTVHNINTYKETIRKGNQEIILDENTEIICHDEGGLNGILNSECKKFITIGRFSPEKGHIRLLKAFDKFCENYPDTKLIIIGGYGDFYTKTRKFVDTLKYSKNVTLINWISNPMSILKQCDLFILSSLYEGWGMVLMEADALGIPFISTDIIGIQWIKNYGGHAIENSKEGILQGMYDYMDGKVKTLNMDFEEYNKQAIKEFEELLEE